MRVVNSTGSYDFTYVYEGNTLVARINPDGSKQYEHTDHLGSTSVITNQNGNVVENTSYTPYGEELSGGNLDVKGDTGQFDDEATGQMYYGARYYKPGTAQFVQGDPVLQNPYDPQFLNHYAYVRNNPYLLFDPNGQTAVLFQGFAASNQDQVSADSGVNQIYQQLNSDVRQTSQVFAPNAAVSTAQAFVQNQLSQNANQPVVIIGHSMGAGKALELQRALMEEGISVNLVITLDPTSPEKIHRDLFKENIPESGLNANFYQEGGLFALTGNQLHGAHNILIDDTHTGIDSNPFVQYWTSRLTNTAHDRYLNRFSSSGGAPVVSNGGRTVNLGSGGRYGSFKCYASSCSRRG